MLCAAWLHGLAVQPRTLADRAEWRRLWAARTLHAMGISVVVEGDVPAHGFVVANHVSYVDVLALGGVLPAIFVSKAEVRDWPLVGALIHRGGTVFLRRGVARAAAEANRSIAQTLAEHVPVVAFPEGTTTAGDRVLPFHGALFEPAVRAGGDVWPASISYRFRGGGDASHIVAYYGDDTLLPHLFRLAGERGIEACVRFASQPVAARERLRAAAEANAAVEALLCLGSRVRVEQTAAA